MKAVKVVKAIAGMFFVCVAYSCNTGLGPEIDLIAPRLSLSSPALKEIVGDAFPVSGTVSDRGGVTLLSITMGSEKLVGDALVYTPLTGEWRNTLGVWQKKINGEWQTYDSGENQWNVDGERVSWRVLIDVTEADNGSKPQDGEYTITIEVIDGNQNKNADSVQKVKVVYDNQYPQLAVINPPLKPLKNGAVEEAPDFGYTLRDASCLDKLLNGSFELGYQIDDDFLNEGRLTIQFTNAWTDEADKIVYYELDTSTTRRGTITIEESELNHVDASVDMTPMQVRTVLRDDAGNTEEKNHGWFVWCPKADIPWVTLPIANGDSLYVNDVKTGQVFDDDGANNTVEYKIYVYDTQSAAAGSDVDTSKGKEWKEWKDPGYKKPDITNGAWSFTAPNEPGKYYIEVKCNDESGTPGDTVLAWWEVEDVANPQIESFEAAPSILGDLGTGNIVLKGVANDDAGIDAVKIVWIDPAVPNAAAVSVSFIDSGNSGWDTQGASYKLWSVSDTDMNPIADAGGRKRCEFSYPVNIFKELLVDGTTRKMHNQTFFVMAEDTNGNKKVSKFVFPGDTEAPVVTVTELVVDKNRYQLPHPQVIAAIDQNHKVTIKGTWGDNSWRDPAKFKDLSVTWNGTPLKVASFLGDGTWETETGTINNETSAVNITQTGAPVQTGGLVNIGASLADYGGNIGEGTASVTVESNDPMLFFISADQPNGVYAPGGVIDIFLEFNTVVVYSGNTGSVKLKLNTGGYAAYDAYDASKNAAGGSRKHYFKYTVAQGDNLGSLTIDKIEGTAANEWKSVNGIVVVNMGSAIADLSSSSSSNVSNLKDKKSIKLDSVTPGITSFSTTSAEKDYGVGDVVFINATFSEPVTVLNGAAIKLTLNVANGYAGYESSSQDVVRFSYTVRAGDNTATLAVTGIENDGGASGIIKDAAGNKFSIPAGFSGGGGAIGKTIVIDTTQPGKPEVAVSVGGVAYSSSPPAELYANPLTIQAKKIEKAGTIVEYSTDAASANPIWQRYTGALMPTSGDNTYQADVIRTIAAYGAYKIAVRQTDSAGNQSQPSDIIDINMVKPDFLTRIGTINGSGEYSSERLPSIDITLSFNKPVAFPGGVSTELTLNATDTKGVKVKAINTSSSASTGTSFVFRYQAKAGDKTPGSEPLKVIAIGTGNTIFGVKIVQSSGGVDVSQYITLPAGNCLEDNADIRIIAGKPVFASPPPTAINSTNGPSYGGGNADFIIVFDRTISSGQGYIVFTPGEAEYRIPAVLPEARYKALFDNVRPDGFPGTTLPNGADFYEPTVNGADPSYAPDTSAKYVLKFQYDITDPGLGTLKEYMRRKEAVKVPAYSTKVSGGRLTVPLRDSYALPVKGVSYTYEIPADFVKDAFGNGNAASSGGSVTLKGIESPVIRIEKNDETIAGSGLERQAAQPLTSRVKIDCRTPGVTIGYETQYTTDPVRQYLLAKADETTDNGASGGNYKLVVSGADRGKYSLDASGPYTISSDYLKTGGSFIFTNKPYPDLSALPVPVNSATAPPWVHTAKSSGLSSPVTFSIGSDNYADGGMKYRVHAWINDGTGGTVDAYETAYRTVVVFNNYRGNFLSTTEIDKNTNALYMSVGKTYPAAREFQPADVDRSRMWVRGGDATKGTVSIAGFPVSWDEREKGKVRLMSPVDHTPYLTSDNPMIGSDDVISKSNVTLYGKTREYDPHGFYTWYWVTWKIPATTYLGFLRGAMQGDGDADVTPYKTSWTQNGFSKMTEYYAAYPGETRVVNTRVPPVYSGISSPSISGITSPKISDWNANTYYVGGNDVVRLTFGEINTLLP